MDLNLLAQRLREFADARDWEQFHSPKNLVMALASETGELVELFQWLTDQQSREITSSPDQMALIKEEVADLQIYLIRLADQLGIDLEKVVDEKIEKNERKYPVDLAKGNATKYSRRDR